MDIDASAFRVAPSDHVRLDNWATRIDPLYRSGRHYRALIDVMTAELAAQQALLYAEHRHALLLIFQAMDAAGKDSAIKHVMSGVNPQGCQVFSFKQPSAEELAHDFLWRTTRCLPARGHIGIFNRSYYEEVLIVRVQPDILHGEGLPDEVLKAPDFWPQRYRSINDLEAHLQRNGTRILKFFLHVSKDEQRSRLLRRIDDPNRQWKFSAADLQQRESWDDYQAAYAACLAATSSADCPWYVVPADDKPNAHLIISQVVLDALRALHLHTPRLDAVQQRALQAIRKKLAK